MSTTSHDLQNRPGPLIGLTCLGVAFGAILGALTNSINGWVSPTYFRTIMRWHDVADIWRASIAQGIFEGLLFGLAFSVIFVTVLGIVSKARCSFRIGATYVVLVVALALVGWCVGGLFGIGLAAISPEFYRHAFRGVPDGVPEMLRYAWVGGSIWGLELGGLAAVVVASVLFRVKWHSLRPRF